MTHMIIQGRGDSFIEQKLSGGDLSRVWYALELYYKTLDFPLEIWSIVHKL